MDMDMVYGTWTWYMAASRLFWQPSAVVVRRWLVYNAWARILRSHGSSSHECEHQNLMPIMRSQPLEMDFTKYKRW